MWFIIQILILTFSAVSTDHPAHSLGLHHIKDLEIPGGIEVITFDSDSRRIYGVGSSGLMIFDANEPADTLMIDSKTFSDSEEWEATSVAIDPLNRGFVASTWIPDPPDRVPGIVQILDTKTERIVWQFSAGYHPDCVAFTPDGRYLILANECEPGIQDRAGSITLVDLLGVQSAFDMQGMNEIQTYGFRDSNLGEGVTLRDLRVPASLRSTPWIGIEPEYLAPTNDGVWVSLQENNAIAYFDLTTREWTKIRSLNPLSYPFDADDEDGIHIQNHEGIALLPMPDTIAHTVIHGRDYVLIANEGEKDENNSVRFDDAVTGGLLDPSFVHQLQARSDGTDRLGRLWVSMIDGDTDGDGDIDVPSTLGGRSVSLYDVQQDSILWTSQEQHEVITAMLWPERFNEQDSRSDRSGPEPEGLAIGVVGEQTLAFVGLERSDAVLMYDISDPSTPKLLDAVALNPGCSRPEGLLFFSIDERHFLTVASEEGGCLSIYEIH